MDRLKRPITKPARYQTTSSDEAPRKRTVSATIQHTIKEDIRELREVIEKNSSQNNYVNYMQHNEHIPQTATPIYYLPPQNIDKYIQLTPTRSQSFSPHNITHTEYTSTPNTQTIVHNRNNIFDSTNTHVEFQDRYSNGQEVRKIEGTNNENK